MDHEFTWMNLPVRNYDENSQMSQDFELFTYNTDMGEESYDHLQDMLFDESETESIDEH
jgi:hypothetical protein